VTAPHETMLRICSSDWRHCNRDEFSVYAISIMVTVNRFQHGMQALLQIWNSPLYSFRTGSDDSVKSPHPKGSKMDCFHGRHHCVRCGSQLYHVKITAAIWAVDGSNARQRLSSSYAVQRSSRSAGWLSLGRRGRPASTLGSSSTPPKVLPRDNAGLVEAAEASDRTPCHGSP